MRVVARALGLGAEMSPDYRRDFDRRSAEDVRESLEILWATVICSLGVIVAFSIYMWGPG